jgi:hypothetical protein
MLVVRTERTGPTGLRAVRVAVVKAADLPYGDHVAAFGRLGFWLHRALTSLRIINVVVDASAIEVNRRSKRAKTDPIDAGKLLNLLCRYHGGQRKAWGVVNVPRSRTRIAGNCIAA